MNPEHPDLWFDNLQPPAKSFDRWRDEAYNHDPWYLPSVNLNERNKLPELQGGIYFAYQGKNVLYIGQTETGFKGRWAKHHKLPELKHYQDGLKQPIRIAYWVIDDSRVVLHLENFLIRLWQPPLNRTAQVLKPPVPTEPPKVSVEPPKAGATPMSLEAVIQQAMQQWNDPAILSNPQQAFASIDAMLTQVEQVMDADLLQQQQRLLASQLERDRVAREVMRLNLCVGGSS